MPGSLLDVSYERAGPHLIVVIIWHSIWYAESWIDLHSIPKLTRCATLGMLLTSPCFMFPYL